jgi:predicted phage-related endonuclease
MIIHQVEQNSVEWVKLKLGKFSASSCAELLMKDTTEGYTKLIKRIVEERITGEPSENKWNGNKYTERGHDLESVAIENFELRTFTKVNRVGFIELSEWVGCSPDGLIGEDTMIQVKNPIFSTQLDYLEDQKIPTNYFKQMQFELFVAEREKNIFYSYHPKLPAIMLEIGRDEKLIKEIEERLRQSIETVIKRIDKIRSSN